MRWHAVGVCDAAVFAVLEVAAVEVFKRTGNVRPLMAIARASASWRRVLVWLFHAPT